MSHSTVEKVTLVIPCRAEYVGIARLAILGVANRLSFSYDEVEDVRLAVGEACGQAIERASTYTQHLESQGETAPDSAIRIESSISDSTLSVEISDAIPTNSEEYADTAALDDGIDYLKLGAVLIEILVDTVSVTSNGKGTTVTLTKTTASAT